MVLATTSTASIIRAPVMAEVVHSASTMLFSQSAEPQERSRLCSSLWRIQLAAELPRPSLLISELPISVVVRRRAMLELRVRFLNPRACCYWEQVCLELL